MPDKITQEQIDAFGKFIQGMPKTGGGGREKVYSDMMQKYQQMQQDFMSQQYRSEADAMRLPMPEYKIPAEISQAMGIYKDMSRQGLPGEDMIKDRIMEGYAGAASNINRVADSSAGALGAMSGLYGRAMGAIRDLGIQSAQVKRQNQQNYAGALSTVAAPYQDKAWEYNYNLPYQRAENAYWNLRSASDQYKMKALDSQTAQAINNANLAAQRQEIWMDMVGKFVSPFGFGSMGGGGKGNTMQPTYGMVGQSSGLPTAPSVSPAGQQIALGSYTPSYQWNPTPTIYPYR